jgi:hypothetical protein
MHRPMTFVDVMAPSSTTLSFLILHPRFHHQGPTESKGPLPMSNLSLKSRDRSPLVDHILHPMSVNRQMVGPWVYTALHYKVFPWCCLGLAWHCVIWWNTDLHWTFEAPRSTITVACTLLSFQGIEHPCPVTRPGNQQWHPPSLEVI